MTDSSDLKKITKDQLKRRIKRLKLSIYEATVLLGFTDPSSIYGREKISLKTKLALERLELLASLNRLDSEKKRNAKAIAELTKKIRRKRLEKYHAYKLKKDQK